MKDEFDQYQKPEKGKLVGVCNCHCHCGLPAERCITDHDEECEHCLNQPEKEFDTTGAIHAWLGGGYSYSERNPTPDLVSRKEIIRKLEGIRKPGHAGADCHIEDCYWCTRNGGVTGCIEAIKQM